MEPCEHEDEELIDESGNSTHIWICKKCGRAKKSGLYAFEEQKPAKEAWRKPEKRWLPDLVICTDILRAVARGSRSQKAIYNSVRRELAAFEELADYTGYLTGLGYLSDAAGGNRESSGRGYELTRAGREALSRASGGIERALGAFPREGRRGRKKA